MNTEQSEHFKTFEISAFALFCSRNSASLRAFLLLYCSELYFILQGLHLPSSKPAFDFEKSIKFMLFLHEVQNFSPFSALIFFLSFIHSFVAITSSMEIEYEDKDKGEEEEEDVDKDEDEDNALDEEDEENEEDEED